MFSGFLKSTLLDYPGVVSSIVFLKGCPWRCPWCHNRALVIGDVHSSISEKTVLEHLYKRKGLIDGLVVTGGEPLMKSNLVPFLREVKKLGIKIKLDTNGYYPEKLQELIEDKLIDYIAMDVKNQPSKYVQTCGVNYIDLNQVDRSLAMLKAFGKNAEVRVTVMEHFHTIEDLKAIGDWVAGVQTIALQGYRYSPDQINNFDYGVPGKEMLYKGKEYYHKNNCSNTVEIRGL